MNTVRSNARRETETNSRLKDRVVSRCARAVKGSTRNRLGTACASSNLVVCEGLTVKTFFVRAWEKGVRVATRTVRGDVGSEGRRMGRRRGARASVFARRRRRL